MFVEKCSVLFMFSFFVFCESGFVENLPKCHLDDNECLRNLYETMVRDIGKTGIPDLKIPPVDPIEVLNLTVSVLNAVNITLIKGVAIGIKDCRFEKFSINITQEIGHQENTCDLTIKGRYKVESTSPIIKNLFGENSIRGEGNGKITIKKMHLKFDFPFYAQKRSDGEIYIKCLYDFIKYKYKIGGVTSFYADNLVVGNQELSETIINLLNENSGFIMAAFGQPFVDAGLKQFYFKFAGNFFDNVPARNFIIDDLTPYAKP